MCLCFRRLLLVRNAELTLPGFLFYLKLPSQKLVGSLREDVYRPLADDPVQRIDQRLQPKLRNCLVHAVNPRTAESIAEAIPGLGFRWMELTPLHQNNVLVFTQIQREAIITKVRCPAQVLQSLGRISIRKDGRFIVRQSKPIAQALLSQRASLLLQKGDRHFDRAMGRSVSVVVENDRALITVRV